MLFITTQLPYPPFSGGLIKSWRLLQFLNTHYEVTVVNLLKGDDPKHEAAFLEALAPAGYHSFAWNVERNLINLLHSYLKRKTLNLLRNYNPKFEKQVHEIIKKHDCVVIDHYEMAQYVPKDYAGKVILHTHNAEYMMWKRFAELEKQPIKRWALTKESKRVAVAELNYCQRADLIFAAPNDQVALQKLGMGDEKFSTTYHLGKDEALQLPDVAVEATNTSLMFIGTLRWEANVDGLLWFIEHIWPSLKERHPDLRFYIIGKNPPARLRAATKQEREIVLTGFVEDPEPYYQTCRCMVVPLRFGSGIKVKILDAMYRGIPCVTTPIGVEGLDVQTGRELLICESATAFIEQTSRLLEDDRLWKKLQQNARKKAKEKYTWDQLLRSHLNALSDLQIKPTRSDKNFDPAKTD